MRNRIAATNHKQREITDATIEQRIEESWQQRAAELAASVPTGRLEVVTSGHRIQLLHPAAVVAAVRSVVADQPGAS